MSEADRGRILDLDVVVLDSYERVAAAERAHQCGAKKNCLDAILAISKYSQSSFFATPTEKQKQWEKAKIWEFLHKCDSFWDFKVGQLGISNFCESKTNQSMFIRSCAQMRQS